MGSPLWYPTGTEMAGVPVKLAGFVKSDARNAAEISSRPPKIFYDEDIFTLINSIILIIKTLI